MLIKQPALKSHLKQKLAPIYLLFGADYYLFNKAAEDIKLAWRALHQDVDESIFTISSNTDWSIVAEEVNSYSLFSSHSFIDIRYDKKTMDATGKAFLTQYLQKINTSALLLIRAPLFTQKQCSWLTNSGSVMAIQASPLSTTAMHQWIGEQFKSKNLQYDPKIPALIQQYTQGNMLACSQVIEKLGLMAETPLSIELVKDMLVDQCDFQLYELADACLASNPEKVLQLLRYTENCKIEPSLILWLLAQEIRLLIQLSECAKEAVPFPTACNRLKIWPQRSVLYQNALKKLKPPLLSRLLSFCKTIDGYIKSNNNQPIWQNLDQIALSLCLAKPIGPIPE